ncbi:MFS transporter [Actinoalloteichus spitiensis]|uniref:MFS transporter n=1 Tax=Actinoalloteichus spitiensis TaxID=252394 RepID=UPI000A07B0FA|nr:MFS transporter [Actinoalloteichus spitiensis]
MGRCLPLPNSFSLEVTVSADRASRQAWLIWAVAVVVYLAAVLHRGSLGVAGPMASERFAISSSALATFTVLHLIVYAIMQIPAGLLVDRFGPKRVLVASVLLMGVGQVLFALGTSYPLALFSRVTVGVGDSLTWVALLRTIAVHFTARNYALVVAMSNALGALGGVIATVPLALALGYAGWTTTFLLLGLGTLGYSVVVGVVMRPGRLGEDSSEPQGERVDATSVFRQFPQVWRIPGTRLAFWVHFSTGMLPGMLGLLWGYSYLVESLGLSSATASMVIGLFVFTGVVGGPIIGASMRLRPESGMWWVLAYLALSITGMLLLTLWPDGTPPAMLACVAFLVFASGGPITAVAFALIRDYNPMRQMGTAIGLANVGGHLATASSTLLIGVLLDMSRSLSVQHAYQVGLAGAFAMLLLGSVRTVVWWRRARAVHFEAQERGEAVPMRLRPRRWDVRGDRRRALVPVRLEGDPDHWSMILVGPGVPGDEEWDSPNRVRERTPR